MFIYDLTESQELFFKSLWKVVDTLLVFSVHNDIAGRRDGVNAAVENDELPYIVPAMCPCTFDMFCPIVLQLYTLHHVELKKCKPECKLS